jgi:5-hydroxyisourate hydrolase
MSSPITTHVLDTARGAPAAGVRIVLERESAPGQWVLVGEGTTDADGRLKTLMAPGSLAAGTYRLTFETGDYFRAHSVDAFWETIVVPFVVRDPKGHFHVPLLVSPFGYSTYRGS